MKDGTVTAGNASQQNDAAAACLVVAEDKLKELEARADGLSRRLGRRRLRAGDDGHRPGAGGREAASPGPGSASTDIDLVELNEAFACQVLAVLKGWGWNDPGPAQRQRLRHLARPSDRRDRRAHPDDAAARTCSGARAATGSRPCASAAARASRRSSSGPREIRSPTIWGSLKKSRIAGLYDKDGMADLTPQTCAMLKQTRNPAGRRCGLSPPAVVASISAGAAFPSAAYARSSTSARSKNRSGVCSNSSAATLRCRSSSRPSNRGDS